MSMIQEPAPKKFGAKLPELETEIAKDISELEAML
jgi:hypothetical protein